MDIVSDLEGAERLVKATGWNRIGIDGVEGAGKSYLAEKLCEVLEYPQLNLDDYLHQNQGGYVDFIDYPALSAAMKSLPAFVLSGLCLREVLANVDTELDGHVYIKRMSNGVWVDEDQCVFPDGVDAAIDSLARQRAMISDYFDEPRDLSGPVIDGEQPEFVQEVMRYHEAYAPQDDADLIFERTAGGG
ncbi:MAG: hypothetical protein ABW278_11810 [Steroidobacteraceae bacterium]